jgi:hypothetical protein
MQAKNAAECGPPSESSPLDDHSGWDHRLRELDWKVTAIHQDAAAVFPLG